MAVILAIQSDDRGISSMSFIPTGLGNTIFTERYALEGETWMDTSWRVAEAVAKAEHSDKFDHYRDEFYRLINDGLLMPGGRIVKGAGQANQQMLNCVSGETLVHTQDGLVPASDLVGKTVATLSQDGVYRLAKWDCYGKQDLYEVLFDNGDTIQATSGHEWIVTKRHGGTERVTTSDLVGRRVPLQHRTAFVYDENSYSEGVKHGLIFGDGSIHSQGKSYLLQFADSKHLVEDHFDTWHARSSHVEGGAVYSGSHPAEWKTDIPDGSDLSYARGFLAGVVAADGCVDSRGHVMLHNRDWDTLVTIRRLAAEVGIPSTSIKTTRTHNPWTGQENFPVHKLTFVKAAMWDEKMILKNSHREKMFNSPEPTKRATMKVASVTPSGRFEDVFCCDEPETHSWVAGAGYLTGNCFVVPAEDTIQGWANTVGNTMIISARSGGVGTNYSAVRGRGYDVGGIGGSSTGAVSLMQAVDRVGDIIKDGAGRRTALMMCLNVNHPDIEEFLDVKLDQDQLNNANISVVIPPDLPSEEFVRLVREDGDIELRFNGVADKFGRTVKARWLFDKVVENAWQNGEPGILNSYEANRMNNVWYHHPLISTNPCGEIWLPAYGCCDLGALVLPRFVKDGDLDWDLLDESVRLGVRFLDDVLDVNQYPLPEIERVCQEERRLGLGVMGLHSMLLDLGMRYDSDEAFEFVDRLFKFIKHTAYDASATLSAEKGPFAAYDARLLQSGFMKGMKPGIRNKIKANGLRNCALLTIAPTGTTSMVQGVTGGIEPVFSPVYIRRRKVTDSMNHESIVETLVVSQEYVEHPSLVQGAYDIAPANHLKMQRVIQKHIDNAVSKTVNLPKDFPVEGLAEMWLDNLPFVKGATFYREGSRETADQFEPMKYVPAEQMQQTIDAWTGEIEYELPEVMDCASGACTT